MIYLSKLLERKSDIMNKKLILVASPPACGKTYLARKLARTLKNAVYMDKDALNAFGKQICKVAGEPYNPDTDFFRANVREIEYAVTMDMAFEALIYANTVIVNAPFARELGDVDYMKNIKARATDLGARLVVVFIESSPEICKRRMIDRNSIRDVWKLENWDEYISAVNFKSPTHLNGVVDLFLYHNPTDEIAEQSFEQLLEFLNN